MGKCLRCGAEVDGYKYCVECREKGKTTPKWFQQREEKKKLMFAFNYNNRRWKNEKL